MAAHRLEVADVFRNHGAKFLQVHGRITSTEQHKVLRALASCRTAALGGHKATCDQCGHEEFFYNSCRNRHCPKCQGAARAKWLDARSADLLPVDYFHIVFTLPEDLGPVALQNKRALYTILFRAVSETLLTIARDPKHLGADVGFLAVLHTWGQRLNHHPHIHCVIPAGGLSRDHKRWVSSKRQDFFLPVRVLGSLFKKKFLAYLSSAITKEEVRFFGKLSQLDDASRRSAFLRDLDAKSWVVYAKPPFGGPEYVLKYLARYTHRVAISNHRLVAMDDQTVTFQWKDYASGNRKRTSTIESVEFIRRFLLHVLPKGFQHIRQYGFLANRVRKERLGIARELLAAEDIVAQLSSPKTEDLQATNTPEMSDLCPVCKKGHLSLFTELSPNRQLVQALFSETIAFDTS